MVKLATPWEINILQQHLNKKNNYYDLQKAARMKAFYPRHPALEVGVRGCPLKIPMIFLKKNMTWKKENRDINL